MNSPSSADSVRHGATLSGEVPDRNQGTRGGQQGGAAPSSVSTSDSGDPLPLTQAAVDHLDQACQLLGQACNGLLDQASAHFEQGRQILRQVYCAVPVGAGAATDATRQELIEAGAQASDLIALVDLINRRLRSAAA